MSKYLVKRNSKTIRIVWYHMCKLIFSLSTSSRRACPGLVCGPLNGSSCLVSQLRSQSISLHDLHPDPFVLVHELLKLSFYVFLLKFKGSLGLLKLLQSAHKLSLLVLDPISFLQAASIFCFAINLFFVELGGVGLENVVFFADMMSLVVQFCQVFVQSLQCISQLAFFLSKGLNLSL